MKLDSRYFGLSAGIIAAVTFVLCGLLVAIAPGATQAAFSYVMHVDLAGLSRTLTVTSFFVGLVVFSLFVGLCVYGTAALYNALKERRQGIARAREAPVGAQY
jgi:uncharacterized protein YjeT (DUF2065 family)